MEYVGGGVDYNSGPYTVQFDVGITRALFTIPLIDDNIMEDNETFSFSVNASSLPSAITVSDSGQTTVTIVANDGKYKALTCSLDQTCIALNGLIFM